jgi:integrase
MALNDLQIRNIKPTGKQFKVHDERGLFLRIKPNGSKLWQMDYRFAGLRKTISFGAYPERTLAEAREKRDQARKLITNDVDPLEHKKSSRVTVEMGETFGDIAVEYLAQCERDLSPITYFKYDWLLRKLAKALWKIPIDEVTSKDILGILLAVENSGRRDTAITLRSRIGGVFRFAIARQRAKFDPTQAIKNALRPPKVKHRAALVERRPFGGLLRCIDEYDGWPTLRHALRFEALTFPRPVELRKAEWVEFDLGNKVWHIPEERMKVRRPHDVPLSRQAIDVLLNVKIISGAGRLVFPSIRSADKILSENALNSALRRMGFTKDEATAHGFRSSASTILNQAGYRSEVIEMQLAHIDHNEVRRSYNRAQYWPERVKMMQSWADLIDEMKKPTAD